MRCSHKTLLIISGLVWLAIGLFLLNLGITFVAQGQAIESENRTVFLVVAALVLGQIKGRFVMTKVAHRSFQRITALTHPTSLRDLYTRSNYLLIVAMMGLGILMRSLALSHMIRGFIDIAVGTALTQGALAYIRLASQSKVGAE
jgi:hypothetical protein